MWIDAIQFFQATSHTDDKDCTKSKLADHGLGNTHCKSEFSFQNSV